MKPVNLHIFVLFNVRKSGVRDTKRPFDQSFSSLINAIFLRFNLGNVII